MSTWMRSWRMLNCTLSLFVYSIVCITSVGSSCTLVACCICTVTYPSHDLGINNGVSGYQEHSFIHRLESTAHPCTVNWYTSHHLEQYKIEHAIKTTAAYIWNRRPEWTVSWLPRVQKRARPNYGRQRKSTPQTSPSIHLPTP